MNLSDAILKGCEMIPEQSYGEWFGYLPYIHIKDINRACVLGTAIVGIAGTKNYSELGINSTNSEYIKTHIPSVKVILDIPCPALAECDITFVDPNGKTLNPPFSVLSYCVHLNDHHRLTREKIAEWIKSLEMNGVI